MKVNYFPDITCYLQINSSSTGSSGWVINNILTNHTIKYTYKCRYLIM